MINKREVRIKEKGITLIALIVTIIVLLIVAGISLKMALGNDGLISKTRSAKKMSEIADTIEDINLILYQWQLVKNRNNKTFDGYLDEKVESGNLDDWYSKNSELYTLVKNEYEQDVNERGNLIGEIRLAKSFKEYDYKITFNANGGNYKSNKNINTLIYNNYSVNKKRDVVKHLYTRTFNEDGEQIDTTSSPETAIETKTAKIDGASKLKINIKHGIVGTLGAIKSVPQQEPYLWECSSSAPGTEEFEIEGDTVNLFFGGGLGGLYNYYGYYATIIGYDSDGNVIQEELEEKENKLLIDRGNYTLPVRFESAFRGWYSDAECTDGNEVLFDNNGIIQNPTSKDLTVYAKWATETIFKNFNGEIRTVTGVAGPSDYDPIPAKYLKKSSTPPDFDNSSIISEIQTQDSAYPIYLWYIQSSKTLYWYCEVSTKMRGDYDLFYLWKDMVLVDFRGIDMSGVTSFSRDTGFWSGHPYVLDSQIIFDESYPGQ